MFYRDQVNRMNPNKHAGMGVSSNLVRDYAKYVPTIHYEETVDGDTIISLKRLETFVVCKTSPPSIWANQLIHKKTTLRYWRD